MGASEHSVIDGDAVPVAASKFLLPAGGSPTPSARREPAVALSPQRTLAERAETDSLSTVRRRERIFRRAIMVGDASAAALAALLAIVFGTTYSLQPTFFLVLPM